MLDKNKKKSPFKNTKTALFSSLLAGSVLLTACGGGGGSGGGGKDLGGPVEGRVTLVTDFPETITRDDNIFVEATFVEIVRGDFKAMMNGTDVTHLFDIGATTATASLASLFSYIDDGKNTFKVSAGGDTESDTFVADIVSGHVMITSAIGVDNKIAQPGEDITVNGLVRKANPASIKFTSKNVIDQIISFPVENIVPSQDSSKKDSEADYSFVANYDDFDSVTTNYAANGRTINTLAGLQINNTGFKAFEPVLGKIIGRWLNIYLEDNPIAMALQTDACPIELSGGFACQVEFKEIGNEKTQLKPDVGLSDEIDLEHDIELDVTILNDPDFILSENGFKLDIKIDLAGNAIDINTNKFKTSEDKEWTVRSRLITEGGSYIKASLIAYVGEDEDTDDKFIGLRLHYNVDEPETQNPFEAFIAIGEVKASTCATPSAEYCKDFNGARVNDNIKSRLNATIPSNGESLTLSEIITNSLNDSVGKDLVITDQKGEETTRPLYLHVSKLLRFSFNSKGKDKTLHNDVQSTSVVIPNKTKTGASDVNPGGIFAIGGSVKLSQGEAEPEKIPSSLGFDMNVKPLSMMAKGGVIYDSADVDVSIAVSDNFLNQSVYTQYQSGKLLYGKKIAEGSDASKLSSQLPALPYNIIATMESQPRLKIQDDKTIMLYAGNINLDVNSPISGTIFDVIETKVDIEAKLALTFDESSKPRLSLIENSLYVRVPLSTVNVQHSLLKAQVTNKEAQVLLLKALPAIIKSQVEGLVNGLVPSIASNPHDVDDIFNLESDKGTAPSKYAQVIREELPKNTYQLILPSDSVNVDNTATALILNGLLEVKDPDSPASEKSFLDISFCSSSEHVGNTCAE